MERKTVIEHLQQAKIDGHEWAEMAIQNCEYTEKQGKAIAKDLPDALMYGFSWGKAKFPTGMESEQKAKYWGDVYRELKKKK